MLGFLEFEVECRDEENNSGIDALAHALRANVRAFDMYRYLSSHDHS